MRIATHALLAATVLLFLAGCGGGDRGQSPPAADDSGARPEGTAPSTPSEQPAQTPASDTPAGDPPSEQPAQTPASDTPAAEPGTDGDPARQTPPELTGVESAEPNNPERELCTITIAGTPATDTKYAIVYSYYTLAMPDEVTKLDSELLEQGFGSIEIGVFAPDGKQGCISGFELFGAELPGEFKLTLAEQHSVKGAIGIKAQIWACADEKWEAASELLEETIQVDLEAKDDM